MAKGIVEIILAVILFFCGEWKDGWEHLKIGIDAAVNNKEMDWDDVRCTLYWLRRTLWQIDNAIQAAMTHGALAYPLPRTLGASLVDSNPDTPIRAVALCRSREYDEWAYQYPYQMDKTAKPCWKPEGDPAAIPAADLNYWNFPEAPTQQELGETQAASLAPEVGSTVTPFRGKYPDEVIEEEERSGGVLSDDFSSFPSQNVAFGGAVANAVQVIKNDANDLVDYNLDADRGYGWKTWNPWPNTYPGAGFALQVKDA